MTRACLSAERHGVLVSEYCFTKLFVLRMFHSFGPVQVNAWSIRERFEHNYPEEENQNKTKVRLA